MRFVCLVPVRLLLSGMAVLYHTEWLAAKGLFVVLMCCVVLLRAQKKYSNHEIQQTNGQRTYIVLAQNFWPQKRYSW